jgi:hypothetical protein
MLCYLSATIWCVKVVGHDGSLREVRLAIAVYTVLALVTIGLIGRTDRIFKRHFSAGPAGAQPPWNTPAAMWRIVFTPRRRWVGQ